MIEKYIRDVPDFPKEGILFKDITPLLEDAEGFKATIDHFADRYRDENISKIVGIEARGFVFGAPLAYQLGCGLGLIRKKGKLPYETISHTYDLEYGTDTVEMHIDTVEPGERVIVIDRVPERLALAASYGKAETIDYSQTDVKEALDEMTGGRGPDAGIDAVGA